jgi:hypothetical protein
MDLKDHWEGLLLSHLLEDDEALLNYFNLLSVADNLLLLNDRNRRARDMARKIVGATKVVKVVQASVTSPVVKGARFPAALIPSDCLTWLG